MIVVDGATPSWPMTRPSGSPSALQRATRSFHNVRQSGRRAGSSSATGCCCSRSTMSGRLTDALIAPQRLIGARCRPIPACAAC